MGQIRSITWSLDQCLPLTQYLFCVMQRPNLPLQSVIDISHVLPVYISHIRGFRNSELSGAVHVIARKGRVQEAVPYHMYDVVIVIRTRNDFFLLPLGLRIAPNVKCAVFGWVS